MLVLTIAFIIRPKRVTLERHWVFYSHSRYWYKEWDWVVHRSWITLSKKKCHYPHLFLRLYFCNALLRYTIALKNSRHFFIQSEVKLKPIVNRLHAFFRALRQLHVFTKRFDWLCVLLVYLVLFRAALYMETPCALWIEVLNILGIRGCRIAWTNIGKSSKATGHQMWFLCKQA